MKKKRLLDGHKRVGKTFIPPMMQLSGLRQTSYVNDMLPELLWLGLVNDSLGFVNGARFFEKVVAAAVEVTGGGVQTNYALLSIYNSFGPAQKDAFLRTLDARSLLQPLREYLQPLVILYDECPVRFLGPPETPKSREHLVKIIKSCVAHHIDKYETPGIVLNGMMLISRLITKTLKFSSDISLPDFNAVLNSPDSEEAKRAAGFMRANAIGEFGMLHIDASWARHFWNQGYELSSCEFDYTDNEE